MEETEEEIEGVCQCCGERPGTNRAPSCVAPKLICDECMADPSETFQGCKHGAD